MSEQNNMENNNGKAEQIILSKKKSSALPVILVTVILIVAIVGGYFFYSTTLSPTARYKKQLDLGDKYFDDMKYTQAIAAYEEANEGDIITFGSYEQDNNTDNGKEPIEWYVLEKTDGEAILLSVNLLDAQPYNTEYTDITWENCTLRSWLNNDFYDTAFSDDEKAVIQETNVINDDNPYYGTEGGNNTIDKVWLLSLEEVEKYFGIDKSMYDTYIENGDWDWAKYGQACYDKDNRLCAKPTAYAQAKGAYALIEGNVEYDNNSYAIGAGSWLLRSPGKTGHHVASVDIGGDVTFYGAPAVNTYGVRPALKVVY